MSSRACGIGIALGVLLVPSIAAAQAHGGTAPLGLTAELEVIHINHIATEAGTISLQPRVGYRVTPSVVLELGLGLDRLVLYGSEASASNVWLRPRVLAHHDHGALGVDLAFGVTIDPSTDALFYNQAHNLGATLDLRLRYAVSSRVYLFAGTTGGGGFFGGVQAIAGFAGAGSGSSLTRGELLSDSEMHRALTMTMDLGVGVGVKPHRSARVELEVPIWSGTGRHLAQHADPRTGEDAVLFDEYYALQISGWFELGSLELGGRLAGWFHGDSGRSSDNEPHLVRISVWARGSF